MHHNLLVRVNRGTQCIFIHSFLDFILAVFNFFLLSFWMSFLLRPCILGRSVESRHSLICRPEHRMRVIHYSNNKNIPLWARQSLDRHSLPLLLLQRGPKIKPSIATDAADSLITGSSQLTHMLKCYDFLVLSLTQRCHLSVALKFSWCPVHQRDSCIGREQMYRWAVECLHSAT